MTVKNTIVTLGQEDIMDDMTNKEEQVKSEASEMDLKKLDELKLRLASKREQEKPKPKAPEIVRAINFGIVGSGQAGSRLVEAMYKLKYDGIAINTASQDLQYIDLPESNKLLLNYGLGGAAKSLEIGQAAADAHREQITELINNQLANAQVFIFCMSLGGGSGAGSTETIIDILSEIGKPIIVLTVLPLHADDTQAKQNALHTLDKLLKAVKAKRIHNLICVDNAKLEAIYHDVGQMEFFQVANKAIVEPLDVYGTFQVANYEEPTALAEAVIENLNANLLAGGFDIKQSRYVGFMMCAPKKVWDNIPAANINYANAIIDEQCGRLARAMF